MSAEYSVEEVRAIVDRSIDALRDNKETFQASELEKVHMWIAERIKADEGVVPDGMQHTRRKPPLPISDLGEQDFCFCNNAVSLQMISGGGSPHGYLGKVALKIDGEYIEYFRTPPAQAAQVDTDEICVLRADAKSALGMVELLKQARQRLDDVHAQLYCLRTLIDQSHATGALLEYTDKVIKLTRYQTSADAPTAEPAAQEAQVDALRDAYQAGFREACGWGCPVTGDMDSQAFESALKEFLAAAPSPGESS